ncbi:phosphotransferase family protein [Neobacillus sp. NRS-1170]|uniref:phosphotransferase family protein n=1 Tax=Neobacillus sp. NRS-1170 TaxID=3233898 RepID=UPI003D2A7C33
MIHSLDSLQDSLCHYLQKKLFSGKQVVIEDFQQASAGWSDDTFILSLKIGQQRKGLVIRKLKKTGLLAVERNLSKQYQLLKILGESSDLPVPKVYLLEEDPNIIGGEFMVMEKIEGVSYVPWSKEGQAFLLKASSEKEIPKQFADYLISLHTLNLQQIGLDEVFEVPSDGTGYIDRILAEITEQYLKYKIIYDPVMTDALEWLKKHRPVAQRLSLLHGDYRTGNMLYKDKRITGILDWELAEIGDPLMDVAYICAKANRMESPLLCYLLDKDWFLDYYSEKTGLTVNQKTLHYFEVLHQVRFLLISLSAAHMFVNKNTSDLRMGRQGFRWTLMRNLLAETIGY